jgi:hypothetical protein
VEDSRKNRTIFINIITSRDIIKTNTIANATNNVTGIKKLPSSSGLFLFLSSFLTKSKN